MSTHAQRTRAARAIGPGGGGGGGHLYVVPIGTIRLRGSVGTAPEHLIVAVRSHNGKAAETTAQLEDNERG